MFIPNSEPKQEPRSLALIIIFFLLLLAGAGVALLAVQAQRSEQQVVHTLEVRRVNQQVLSALLSAESGERGYLLTREKGYLDQYVRFSREARAQVKQLQQLTSDNQSQQALVSDLKVALEARVQELQDTIALIDRGAISDAFVAVRDHLKAPITERVREINTTIDREEARLLMTRQRAVSNSRTTLLALILVSGLVSTYLGFLVLRALREQVRRIDAYSNDLAKEMREREAAESKVRQMQKMEALGNLTGGIAHDFNNMLAVIVGSLDLASRVRAGDEERVRRMINAALDSARRAAQLTRRLLAYSRMQPLSPKPIEVKAFVGDVAELLRRTLGEHIQIETVFGAGVWRANVDVPELESAILNLALNARDAMPKGGKLTIETSNTLLDRAYASSHIDIEPGQYVLIAITDTGGGMSPEVLNKAFDPFFTTKAPGVGTGLGLSQVHGFIKQSKGHIAIYSELGVGTTVKLYLPRYIGELIESDVEGLPQASVEYAKHTVLVVEDEDAVRQFVLEALAQLGFKAVAVSNAEAALRVLADRSDIDVLLTDVVMPGCNGRDLVTRIEQTGRKLKVLYMTGYTQNAIVHNGVLDAGTQLLTKPFTVTQLHHELTSLLA